MSLHDFRAQLQGRARAVATALCVLAFLAALGTATLTRTPQDEKTVLGDLLARVLSTPTSRVSIGAVDGALSSDVTIRDVAISDRDGVWLKLDRARLVWRRVALLSGRLEINSLELGRLEVLRRPLPSPDSATLEPDGSLLPELPVKVEIKGFRLGELVLGESFAGQPARLTADGKAKLGPPVEGLDLDVNVRRLDAAGLFAAHLRFVPKGEQLEMKASLVEPAGGLLSKGANLPGTPPINLNLDGRGTLDDWNADLDFNAGESIDAKGSARMSRVGAERRLSVDLVSRLEGLLPGPAAAVFSGRTKLDGGFRFSDSGAFGIDRLELASQTARLDAHGTLTADRVADFTVSARAVPTEGAITKAAEAELDSLVFDGSLRGPLARPRVNGSLKAAGLRAQGSALDRIETRFSAEPAGPDPNASRFALSADARVEGLLLADPALRRAIGSRATLTFRGTLQPDNIVEVVRVLQRPIVYHVEQVGVLEAEGQTDLAAGVAGIVDEVLFREGSFIANCSWEQGICNTKIVASRRGRVTPAEPPRHSAAFPSLVPCGQRRGGRHRPGATACRRKRSSADAKSGSSPRSWNAAGFLKSTLSVFHPAKPRLPIWYMRTSPVASRSRR